MDVGSCHWLRVSAKRICKAIGQYLSTLKTCKLFYFAVPLLAIALRDVLYMCTKMCRKKFVVGPIVLVIQSHSRSFFLSYCHVVLFSSYKALSDQAFGYIFSFFCCFLYLVIYTTIIGCFLVSPPKWSG